MAADSNPKTGPATGKPQPGEEFFKQSLADLSRRLGERAARQAPPGSPDAQAEVHARRAAMRAYDLARARRLRLWLAAGGAVIATACVAWFVVLIGAPDIPPSLDAMVRTEPASPTVTASAEPVAAPSPAQPQAIAPTQTAPSSPPSPSLATNVPSPPAVEPAAVTPAAPAADSQPAPAPQPIAPSPPPASVATTSEPPPVESMTTALRRDEVVEVQKKLLSLGFNPGPIDGAAGPMTEKAVLRYRQNRGQQTGQVDRQLLEQLRQDPAPQVPPPQVQVAQRARPGANHPASASAARSSDPFEPLRVAGYRITQWMQSLTH